MEKAIKHENTKRNSKYPRKSFKTDRFSLGQLYVGCKRVGIIFTSKLKIEGH